MTSPTLAQRPASTARPSDVRVGRVTFGRVLASEWVKFRSLRSTWWTLLIAVAAMVGISALISWARNARWSQMPPREAAAFEPIITSLRGVDLAQLAIAVLGVLLISGEYATGMIRSTLTAVPKRLPVLWAKTLLFAVVTFVSMLVSALAAFLVGQQLLASHGTTLSAPGAVRAVIAVAGYLTLVGVLAVALGFIIRSTAGGIATLVGLLLVAPGLGQLLPSDWQPHILPYLPSNAGAAMYTVRADPTLLSPGRGLLTLVIWAVVAVVAAAVLLRRRDA
ncbi:MAG TPA: ABC transporter permease [Propionibacteriaceae bacterium]|nr:ABC transporter permease [Propionibacteriaceae bacterium]